MPFELNMRVYLTATYRKGLSIAFKKLRRKFVMEIKTSGIDALVFFTVIFVGLSTILVILGVKAESENMEYTVERFSQ